MRWNPTWGPRRQLVAGSGSGAPMTQSHKGCSSRVICCIFGTEEAIFYQGSQNEASLSFWLVSFLDNFQGREGERGAIRITRQGSICRLIGASIAALVVISQGVITIGLIPLKTNSETSTLNARTQLGEFEGCLSRRIAKSFRQEVPLRRSKWDHSQSMVGGPVSGAPGKESGSQHAEPLFF